MSVYLNNVTKAFDGRTVLEGVSFDFPEHGAVAVIGKSGSGKTTLLRIIAGLDRTYRGKAVTEGAVAVSFQEYRLFPALNALENVLLAVKGNPTDGQKKRAEELLMQLGFCAEDMKKTPDGLSGGMKQRVSLARAFMSDAPTVILDEPTKELDEALAAVVRNLIQNEARSRLVIFTAHGQEQARLITDIIIALGPQE